MTEPRNPWDDAQNAVADALTEVNHLYAQVPATLATTSALNRIVMAMDSLETAKDQLAAARARMPKEGE
jgi:hypothetical protein